MAASEEGKYLYCSRCKEFPNLVNEIILKKITRLWGSDCYIEVDDETIEHPENRFVCAKCGTILKCDWML